MREPEDMGWYEVIGDDGYPRACHGIKRLMPDGSKEISLEEAQGISAAVRAREVEFVSLEPGRSAPSAPAAAVDLSSIHARLDALSEESIAHTEKLEAITSQVERVEGAVNDMTAGLTGEK